MRLPYALLTASTIGLLFLPGCEALTGKEVARLTIDSVSTDAHIVDREAMLSLKKGDKIALWSHMDLSYDGNVELRFRVRMLKDGTEMPMMDVDPFDRSVTVFETKSEMGGHTNWSFTGKNKVVDIAEDGTYTFKAILIASESPGLQIRKAELLLKQ